MANWDGRILIANERLETKDKIKVENPATLEFLGEVLLASSEDCRRAVEAAHKAYPAWRDISLREKRAVFLKAKEILLRRSDEIARLIKDREGISARVVEISSGPSTSPGNLRRRR